MSRAPAHSLTLYGVPFSQPVRAVMWLLIYKQLPFNMVLINPGSKGETGSRNPAFLEKNPGGTIPTIEEPGATADAPAFTLGEAHAIMCYLCNQHGWSDVYPTDARERARIDWYLNYHHRNIRDASVGLVAPKIRKDLNIPESTQNAAKATLTNALSALEAGWLKESPYLTGQTLSLADFAAYVEVGQIQPQFTNLFDFSPYPKVQAWLERMQGVPGHDTVHTVLRELGDISQEAPSMEKIVSANKSALQALKAALAEFAG